MKVPCILLSSGLACWSAFSFFSLSCEDGMARHSLESEVIIDLVDIVARGKTPSDETCRSASRNDSFFSGEKPASEEETHPITPCAGEASSTSEEPSESYETASEYGMENYPGWIAYRSEESETMLVEPVASECPEQASSDHSSYTESSQKDVKSTSFSDPAVERTESDDNAGRSQPEMDLPSEAGSQGSENLGMQSPVDETGSGTDSMPRDSVPDRLDQVVPLRQTEPEADEKSSAVAVPDVVSEHEAFAARLLCLEQRMALVEENVAALACRIEALEEADRRTTAVPSKDEISIAENRDSDVPEEQGRTEEQNMQPDSSIFETVDSLCARVAALEALPPCPEESVIVQQVLGTVRKEIDSYTAEQSASIVKVLSEMQRRIRELEMRPAPQLLLPELPDAEGMVETVLERLRGELDTTVAAVAARVLREEIAALRKSGESRKTEELS